MDFTEFQREIFLCSRDMQRILHEVLSPICHRRDLTPQQMHVLLELSREPGQTAGQLSDRAGILRTNFSPVCRKLESRGLIERRRSERDGRAYELQATAAGYALLKDIEQDVRQRFGSALEDEPPETFDAIIKGLQAVRGLSAKLGV